MGELLAAGSDDFIGGQDASKIPDRIPDNCYASGINVSTKKASIMPRWGFEKQDIIFPTGGMFDRNNQWVSYEDMFRSGKFQLVAPYPSGNAARLLIVIGGIIYLYNIDSGQLFVVPITGGGTLNPRAARLNWSPATNALVIFDFPSYPVIVVGSTARRANPFYYEVPVSVIGTYNENRLFIGNAGSEFTAGDPVGSLATPNAPITFEEIMLPASPYYGQVFQLTTASNNEPITAMGFLQVADIGTGIGPLIIGTEKAIYSYNTQNPRTDWEKGQFGSVFVYQTGIAGPRAWDNCNSDMFYLGNDGYVRTLSMSRNEQSRWARLPVSREVENWLKFSDIDLKRFGFIRYFNNKIFVSANPFRIPAVDRTTRQPITDYAHAGVVVLELDNAGYYGQPVSSFDNPPKPSWAGLWTGVNPMDMVVLNNRLFVISKDEYSINSIWEVNPEITYDTSDCKIRYVKSRIYTKEWDFKDPFQNKELHSVDFNLDALQGDFTLTVAYKPNHSPMFLPWGSRSHKAPWRLCTMPCCDFMNGFAHQMIRDFTIGSPVSEGTCDPATKELYQVFRKAQLRLDFIGKYWEVHEVRIKAVPRTQMPQETPCEETPVVCVEEPCNDDWCVGDFNICPELQTVT